MRMTSSAGDFIDLSITGYQFGKAPTAPPGGWDENWLNISGHVRCGGDSWTFHDPCMTTWEVKELLAWLKRAQHGIPEPIEFTEPNLSFMALVEAAAVASIVVTLKGEAAHPSLSDEDRWNDGQQVALDMSSHSLASIIEAWERDVAQFPER